MRDPIEVLLSLAKGRKKLILIKILFDEMFYLLNNKYSF